MRTGDSIAGRRPNLDLIIVPCRAPVLAVRVDHRQEDAGGFHFAIGPAERPQQVGPRHLEPDEVVGVVDDAHLVRLGVPHAQCGDRGWSHDVRRHRAAACRSARVAAGGIGRAENRRAGHEHRRAGLHERRGVAGVDAAIHFDVGRAAGRLSSAARRRDLARRCAGMNVWPPNPGLTDITSR